MELFVAAALAGFSVNVVARRTLSCADVEGSPRWVWLIGNVFQTAILPALTYQAWRQTPADSFGGWVTAPQELLTAWDRLAVAALFGYFLKDLIEEQAALFHVHHIFCGGMMVGAVFVLPAGGAGVLIGGCVLEVGTASYGWSRLAPQSLLARHLYTVVMTLSNATAAAVYVFCAYTLRATISAAVSASYGVVVAGLLGLRQYYCHLDVVKHRKPAVERRRAPEARKTR
ncbi:hypothetical protein M885DRAFT_626551 [Pelagophyceae sp. CCMP2097]|nr:hypothetical protein M885DRAFT_626551 [Pelagophyceae sp. CCMP2097]